MVTVIKNLVYPVQSALTSAGRKGLRRVITLGGQRKLADLFRLKNETSQGYFQRMLWVPVAFALGCAGYFSLSAEPNLLLCLLMVTALIPGLLGLRTVPASYRAIPEFALILLGFAIFGFCYSGFRAHTMPSRSINSPLERVMIEGWVTDISGRTDRMRLTLDVHAISGVSSNELPQTIRVSQRVDNSILPGRFVRCFSNIQPPPEPMLPGDYDFERNSFFDGLGAVGFVFGNCEPGRLAGPTGVIRGFQARINAQRRATAQYIASSPGEGAGLAAALFTGDRSFLSADDEEILRASGLAHLLAISGLHMGLAAGVFYFAIFRCLAMFPAVALRIPVQKLAGIGALVAITIYLLFSGASVATQRAYIMVVSVLIYSLFDRPLLSFQALAIAMTSVLILAPWSVMTPGFQMSFAATGALLAGYQNVRAEKRDKSGLLSKTVVPFAEGIIKTSWIAGLATMPFALFHFGRAAPLGFFANIVVMPLITLVCVPIAAVAAIAMVFGLGRFPLDTLSYALGWVLDVASVFTREFSVWNDWLPDQMPIPSLVILVFALLSFTILSAHRLKFVALFLLISISLWAVSPRPVLIYDGAGHLFVREQGVWTELDIGGRGLRPLRFSDVYERECDLRCDVPGSELTIDHSGGEIKVSFQGVSAFEFTVGDTEAFQMVARSGELSVMSLERDRCRIWNSNYDTCRGSD